MAMERDIFRYLYKFYKNGNHHLQDLQPVFDELKEGWDYKDFLFKIRDILSTESHQTLEINGKYASWGTLLKVNEEGYFDYTNQRVEAKLTPKGREIIERVLDSERQDEVNNSVIKTNRISRRTSRLSVFFVVLTVFISAAQYFKKDHNTAEIQSIGKNILELKKNNKHIDTVYLLNQNLSIPILDTAKKK